MNPSTRRTLQLASTSACPQTVRTLQASSILTLRMPALASSTAAAGKPPCTARADPDPSFRSGFTRYFRIWMTGA